MIKRYYVKTRQLKEGMRIDQAVLDKLGRTLIARGTILNEYLIDSLSKLRVLGVYISEGEEDEQEIYIPPAIRKRIEDNSIPDRHKVELSKSVKKRVSEGIQYLYTNTDSPDFVEATNNIGNDLMKAIMENDAIAVDISNLKISDEYTFKHSVDVATLSMIIAKQYGLDKQDIYDIGIAGLLHDIGKSYIPNEILNKPGKLTDEEFEIMKKHPVFGYDILKTKEGISVPMRLGVLQHHEKMNGSGYPMGFGRNKICTYAKILSVADIYDALVTKRSYKDALSQRVAVEMLMSMTDQLDIKAIRSFMESIILYPVGSIVNLSNNEKAKVVENNPSCILRPKVIGLKTGKIYNLAEDISCASIIII